MTVDTIQRLESPEPFWEQGCCPINHGRLGNGLTKLQALWGSCKHSMAFWDAEHDRGDTR